MNINNFVENKILYTQNIWKWLKLFTKKKDVKVIMPFTKISDLFNFKNNNLLRILINQLTEDIVEEGLNLNYLNSIKDQINKKFESEIIEVDLNHEKMLKTFFNINEQINLNENLISKYLQFLDETTSKQLQVVIAGFDMKLPNYNMITVHQILSNISEIINWSNIEQLVFLDVDNGLEIIDADKFKSWLELKTKTVLSNKDLDQYFRGEFNFQSFLIEKALQTIK